MIGTCARRGPRIAGALAAVFLMLAAFGSVGCAPAGYATSVHARARISDYDYLDDYGDWVRIPRYGWAWRPYVVAGWSPFYHGNWAWTHDGWAWISYEPFGWMVYHYGFWDYHPRFGWVWVPGTIWSPARVQWYTFGNYCAWAPMPPPHMYWPDPWDPWDINVWIVVDVNHFTNEYVGRHRLDQPVRREMFQRGNVVRRAPEIRTVEQVTKRRIEPVKIEREPANVRRDVMTTPPTPGRPGKTPLRQMVLPEQERARVKEYAPKVEREVLTPKKTDSDRRRDQFEPAKERRDSDTKKETESKQKTRRR